MRTTTNCLLLKNKEMSSKLHVKERTFLNIEI